MAANKSNIVSSESFKYPSKKERREINSSKISIKRLNIKFYSSFVNLLKQNDFQSTINKENTYWWNLCLNNRIGKLSETYVYLMTHYNRLEEQQEDLVSPEKFLFDYYVEIFYYFYFSTRDVLGQLLNMYYNLNLPEHRIFLNENFINKIPNEDIRLAVSNFLDETKDSYNIRNTFNHRYTPSSLDNRTRMEFDESSGTTNFYFDKEEIKSEQFIQDIENLLYQLNILMESIQDSIDQD